MSENGSCESDGSDLGKDKSDSLESMMHMFSIKVEYYRLLEYSVKWKDPMNPKRNCNRPKTLKDQDSPSEDSIQCKTEGKRQQKERKKAQSGKTVADVDKQTINDILDLIDRSHENLPEETSPWVEVADDGVDQSDDDQVSVSSITSGPSSNYDPCVDKPLTLCSACHKLQQKAKRMAPLKHKLLGTNPKSLTCDQWILLKPWRSKKKPDGKRNVLGLVQFIHKLRVVKKSMKKKKMPAEDMCSRQHVFLQRNLHCVKKPIMKERKKNRKKRAREDSQGTRVAKQKRTHKNQPISLNHNTVPRRNGFTHNYSFDPMSSHCSILSQSGPDDSDVTFRLPPLDSFKEFPKQTISKRGGGFRDLLAQLRGNNSMIIKETR
ncbi:uncharacterized protein si:ch211-227n13.3 isoform X1 [Boleophthalmus pectinirostris]|uniref:uncharacterized protein si:ch211-227n13.3 isoform X1 n=3 Tax=Boleophthalmus pectinirostris TaxID=150288 RepID=UPI00242A3405|nr:uncharacterized protein si:ch211-227n13.3 isoform X1 [Boleophthalmus pectinirostris]